MKWVLCCLFISSKSAELETIRELVLEVTQAETAELRLRIEQLEYQLNQTLTLIDERFIDQLDKSELDFKQQQLVTKQISEIELALISNEQRLDFLDIEDYILQSERKFESINNITVKIESEIGQSEQRINELDKKIADYDKTTNDLPAIEERFQTIMNRIEQVNSSLEKTGEKCELLTEGQHLLSLQQNTTFTDLLRVSSEINESKTRYALLGVDLVQNFTQFDTRLADQSHSIQSNFDSITFLTTSLRNQYMKFSPQITNFEERIVGFTRGLFSITSKSC